MKVGRDIPRYTLRTERQLGTYAVEKRVKVKMPMHDLHGPAGCRDL